MYTAHHSCKVFSIGSCDLHNSIFNVVGNWCFYLHSLGGKWSSEIECLPKASPESGMCGSVPEDHFPAWNQARLGHTCSLAWWFLLFWTFMEFSFFISRLQDRSMFYCDQQPDVPGTAQWDCLHKNALLCHSRQSLGPPLWDVPCPAPPLSPWLHTKHPHRSMSR